MDTGSEKPVASTQRELGTNRSDSHGAAHVAPGGQPGSSTRTRFAAKDGGGRSGGGKSPDQQRSIVRQHSQEMAIRFIAHTKGFDDLDPTSNADVGFVLNNVVKRLTDWFAKDAMSAPQEPLNGAAQEVPADTQGLEPAAVSGSDADIPF